MLGLKAIPEDIAKTSLPQTWHKPRGQQIEPAEVQCLVVHGYHSKTDDDSPPKSVKSTLYLPVNREEFPSTQALLESLEEEIPECQIIPGLKESCLPHQALATRYGNFPKGSPVSYQQKLSSTYIYNIVSPYDVPDLPVRNVMKNNYNAVLTEEKLIKFEDVKLSLQTLIKFEKQTRLQSTSPLWHKLRRTRITASKIGRIYSRQRADPVKLVENLKKKTVQTEAMRLGTVNEPLAAERYANHIKQGNVNVLPCGIVVNFWCPWLAASPDRIVYDPQKNPYFGLLEIKCTVKSSVLEVDYVQNQQGQICLKRNHAYYYQVLMQLAVTGMEWCDFFIWSNNDEHLETIQFDADMWQTVKDKADAFYFEYYI
ncbi:uncharacterized protein LOC116300235 [Actinia tenebrosa]|uniref:Uncharacterized protein LOC116300235 n=1 Tax=Actinia tenebrosa TaxID=6105 RepID=A0A6P8I8N2_ACTTE|nr:uncharacterized protein LOC116300235 [Actinia tenebrosa]